MSNVESIIVAMATTRDSSANFDYALIKDHRLAAIGPLQQTEGDSPNTRANHEWHRDLSGLSTDKLNELVLVMFSYAERGRILRHDIENLIREAVRTGQVDRAKMNERLRVRLAV